MPRIDEEHTDQYYIRVDAVVTLILENDRFMHSKRSSELVGIVKKKFLCEDRHAQRIIADARKEIRQIGKKNSKRAFKKAIRDREYIIAAGKVKGNLKVTLAAMIDRDKLNELYNVALENESLAYVLVRGTVESKKPSKD